MADDPLPQSGPYLLLHRSFRTLPFFVAVRRRCRLRVCVRNQHSRFCDRGQEDFGNNSDNQPPVYLNRFPGAPDRQVSQSNPELIPYAPMQSPSHCRVNEPKLSRLRGQ